MSKLTANSRIFGAFRGDSREVPVFARGEVMTCDGLLGNGAFSEVRQVCGFRMEEELEDVEETDEEDGCSSSCTPSWGPHVQLGSSQA